MAEQKLVDAKALSDALYEADAITMKGVIIISQFPTIEAKPVVHAHWLEQIIDGGQELMCSNCGEYALMNDEFYSEFSKYCPYCGAQMDEEINNG